MTLQNSTLSRRAFVKSSVAASGGLMLALSLPKANAGLDPWTGEPTGTEISAWLTIDPNSQVTIRVAQSEMGEGVFTAMPMLVAEELDCDWSQVKAEYASANRSVRENGVYKRMGTGGSGAVRRSREYLQQAGASARERLKAAAAARWRLPVRRCCCQSCRSPMCGCTTRCSRRRLLPRARSRTSSSLPGGKKAHKLNFLI